MIIFSQEKSTFNWISNWAITILRSFSEFSQKDNNTFFLISSATFFATYHNLEEGEREGVFLQWVCFCKAVMWWWCLKILLCCWGLLSYFNSIWRVDHTRWKKKEDIVVEKEKRDSSIDKIHHLIDSQKHHLVLTSHCWNIWIKATQVLFLFAPQFLSVTLWWITERTVKKRR